MKINIFTVLLMAAVLTSCGGNSNSNSDDKATDTQSVVKQPTDSLNNTQASMPIGAKLIAKSDCASCHKEHDKLVGPSYADIAQKYPNTDETKDKLSDKIIKGGSGVWGSVPMTPHPGVSVADAKEMVTYIMSLKK